MLESLSIQNIALIDKSSIEFNSGLNILSGETGAGKSIILDSLSFILGARADKTLIRHGENSAEVRAMFDIANNVKVKNQLEDAGIEPEDELLIVREMTVDGKNTCRVNGNKVTLGMLKNITNGLVDIYGQHDNNALFNDQEHIKVLDNYIGKPLFDIKNDLKEAYIMLHEIRTKLDKIGKMNDVYKKIDILSYEINEIKEANLDVNEEDELNRLSNLYANVETILEGLNVTYSILQGEDNEGNILVGIESSCRYLSNLIEYDTEIDSLNNRLEAVKDELSDISRTISILADNVEYDPYEARRVEERLDTIRSLKRKYGNSIEEILSYLEKIEAEYDEYSNIEETLEKLNIEYDNTCRKLYNIAINLSIERKKYAKKFEKDITKNLAELGMKNSRFIVDFSTKVQNSEEADKITENGLDDVIFLISANIGQEPKPLSKIISGGELSRFMLSLKNILAGTDNIDTMVFDEIDTGISGNIASVVAKKLYNISKDRQVLAVTHLPQLGAMADSHYLIEKRIAHNNTITSVTLLDEKSKVVEVARLMGGDESELSLAHARELIANSNLYKVSSK